MGVFKVPIVVKNWQNRYLPEDQRGEDIETEAMVDTGAAELALPTELIERLRLEVIDTVYYRLADGARRPYRVMGIAEIEVQGRSCQARVIELPEKAQPLLGAVPLELMDWHVSPNGKELLPNPESPNEPLLPLC